MGRACLARVCANTEGEHLFIKTTRIDSIPSKIRILFGLKRRLGIYDWPLAELQNCIQASERTEATPRLIGCGFVRHFGLVSEMFLTYENLEGYIHGLAWIRRHPTQALLFAAEALQLLHRLNRKGVYHLDLWAANIMLPSGELSELKAVDLENCYVGETAYHSETLGFQLGFLYQFALREFVAEDEYDALVFSYLANHDHKLIKARFMPWRLQELSATRSLN